MDNTIDWAKIEPGNPNPLGPDERGDCPFEWFDEHDELAALGLSLPWMCTRNAHTDGIHVASGRRTVVAVKRVTPTVMDRLRARYTRKH